MKNILMLVFFIGLAGCVTTDYKTMSSGSGIPQNVLEQNCVKISCKYDNLKDNVQASASDMNVAMALFGGENRTIQFTWVSGWKQVSVEVFQTSLYGTWKFYKSAEIYINKEMVAELSGSVDRITGTYNNVAKEVEKIEVVSGMISIEVARKIAQAPHDSVTIRFYGKNGYKDTKLPRKHNLVYVTNIASNTLPKVVAEN